MSEYVPPPSLQGGAAAPINTTYQIGLNLNNFQGGDTSLASTLANAILESHASDIDQFIIDQRQQSAIAPLAYRTSELKFNDMLTVYAFNHGAEELHIIAYPTPTGGTTAQNAGGKYDVICKFTGYGIGQLQTQGVYEWAAFNYVDDGAATDDEFPGGLPIPWSVPKVGKSGVLPWQLVGMQYLEVQIVALPTTVPASFTVPYAGVDDNSHVNWDGGKLQPNLIEYDFTDKYNTWLTPAVGFIPSQQFDDHWKDPTTTDDMLLGLEKDDVFQVARSVYAVRSNIFLSDVQTRSWTASKYWLINPTGAKPEQAATLTQSSNLGTHVETFFKEQPSGTIPTNDDDHGTWPINCEVTVEDWNPVYIQNAPHKPIISPNTNYVQNTVGVQQNPTQPVPRGDFSTIGVGGKYLLMPNVTLSSMPVDAIRASDIDNAIATTLATNLTQLQMAIDADAAIGVTDVYATMGKVADPRLSGLITVPQADDYLHGFPKAMVLVSEVGVNDDAPIPVDDDIVFVAGQFQHIGLMMGSLGYSKGHFVDDDYTGGVVMGDYFEGPGANIAANSGTIELVFPFPGGAHTIGFGFEPNNTPQPLVGANVAGIHTWVLKGRGDQLGDPQTAADDGPLVPPIGGEGSLFNGVWSGVDLGELAVDDTIMMATDTGSRKVYFGKNGHWYDKDGKSDFSPGQEQLKVAMLLDGDGKQDYYPAVTLRAGLSHMRFLWGVLTKYQPPPGYKAYGVPPEDTVT